MHNITSSRTKYLNIPSIPFLFVCPSNNLVGFVVVGKDCLLLFLLLSLVILLCLHTYSRARPVSLTS